MPQTAIHLAIVTSVPMLCAQVRTLFENLIIIYVRVCGVVSGL